MVIINTGGIKMINKIATAINLATGIRRLKKLGISIKDGVLDELRAKDSNKDAIILEYEGYYYHCVPIGRKADSEECDEVKMDKA